MSAQIAEPATQNGIFSGPVDPREMPMWFREQQRSAWKEFESLPAPTRKYQLWRFSNVDLLDLSRFKVGAELSDAQRSAILERSPGLDKTAARLVFAGDNL